MEDFLEEVDSNFNVFFESAINNVEQVSDSLSDKKDDFNNSYRRIVSLQAWQSEVVEKYITSNAAEFFREAQNDALMSHLLSRQGAWRVSLMSLRACIENILYGLYYCDHAVELEQWESGDHRLGFSEVTSYLSRHPKFKEYSGSLTGIEGLKNEYATLSKAVHGSSRLFRMTKGGNIEGLNVYSEADFGAWLCREKNVISCLNRILVVFFKDHLQGAACINLKKALSLAIPRSKHQEITDSFGVRLRAIAS